MSDISWPDFLPKMIGVVTVAGTIIVALIQYIINSRAERRQQAVALLESDIKVSSVFSELVEVANGYRGFTDPQKDIIDVIEKALPPQMIAALVMQDPRNVGKLFSASIMSVTTPLARQLAAAESIVNLAIKYPILLEPAIIGLDVTAGFSPFAKIAYDRLCRHYSIKRPLTDWGPDWQGVSQKPMDLRTNEDGAKDTAQEAGPVPPINNLGQR